MPVSKLRYRMLRVKLGSVFEGMLTVARSTQVCLWYVRILV